MSEFAFLKSDGTGCRATCSDADARLVVSDGYYASGTTLDKPDAIDLGKRLLKHFDVLPTKEEVDFIETTLLLRKLAMNSKREIKQCTAIIAKLRWLVEE